MIMKGNFARTVDLIKRNMDVILLRRNVIANNIANSDTPNFKRSVVNFEAELVRALDSEKVKKLEAFMTDERHISFNRTIDYRSVRPRRVLDYLSTEKNNGNNVNIEEETMQAMQNQLLYNTMVTALNSEYNRVNMVLR